MSIRTSYLGGIMLVGYLSVKACLIRYWAMLLFIMG